MPVKSVTTPGNVSTAHVWPPLAVAMIFGGDPLPPLAAWQIAELTHETAVKMPTPAGAA
jgi:hypothetical protein